ncbi:MAG: hypothetical protein VYC34_05670, partial [Planctomycetota bacterium]|nr:hypothetical protein [Planctomycetota bacterium]
MRSEVATRPPIRSLHRLREEIRAIEDRTPGRPASDDAADRAAALPTGWGEGHPGSLARAAIHEWFGPHDESAGNRKRRQAPWSPPLGVFAHLAHRAQRNDPSRPALIWIGRRCWIHPHALLAQDENTTPPLLASSIFVDAAT